jgi:phage baseplate assembly protein W
MATIRLNAITKPRETNSNTKSLSVENFPSRPTYTDLHLDLQIQKNVGEGYMPKESGDIKVDTDLNAIKNAIRNIFNTRKGQKILSPEFGSALEQFLFERVDDFVANTIGNTILDNLTDFEPRVEVLKVQVTPLPDDNRFDVKLLYKFNQIGNPATVILSVMNDGQIII